MCRRLIQSTDVAPTGLRYNFDELEPLRSMVSTDSSDYWFHAWDRNMYGLCAIDFHYGYINGSSKQINNASYQDEVYN